MGLNVNMAARFSQTQELKQGLYIVATPIGNLGDMTYRAVDTLRGCDIIACEDTRTSRTLMQHYDIRTPLIAYHEHNAQAARPKLLAALAEGKRVALISDAGTPLISDPGYKLVQEVAESGYYITSLPGASSVLTALTLAALPTDHFCFVGFLPNKETARKKALASYAHIPATLVMLESPNRVTETLCALADQFPDRRGVVARELTKLFEEVRRDSLPTLAAHYQNAGNPKGEVVILVSPPEQQEAATDEAIEAMLKSALTHMRVKEASELVADATGTKRTTVYQMALKLKTQ